MKILAAVTHAQGAPFSIESVDLASPRAGELRVKIVACGVCHTDAKARDGYFTPYPAVLGHEGAGIVDEVGPGVDDLVPGDPVVLSYPACGTCDNCKRHRPYYCYRSTELSFFGRFQDGFTPLSQRGQPLNCFFGQSAFATYAVVPRFNAIKVDAGLDLKLAAPLGCGIQTGAGAVLNHFRPRPGESIAVFGTGAVGLSAIMAAKLAGCANIIAVDILDARLKIALEFGATHGINSGQGGDVAAQIRRLTGAGVDYALDTTAVEACTLWALGSMHIGGKGGCVAASKRLTLEPAPQYLIGRSWTYMIEGEADPHTFLPGLIAEHLAGKFPFEKMLSFYPFAQINQAFEDTKKGLATKAVLVMPS